MPFELWGASGSVGLALPERSSGYFLLLFYSLLLGYLVYRYRADYRRLSSRQWLIAIILYLASLVTSQLLPIPFAAGDPLPPLSVAQNPVVKLVLFAAVPYLLAGAILNPGTALIAGLFGGLGRALGQTHQLFDLFHIAFAAVLASLLLQQNYLGRLYGWLRHPVASGAVSNTSVTILTGLAAFVSTDVGTSNLVALDLALSTAGANFLPFLISGVFGGAIVTLILNGLPHLRPARTAEPSPWQRSLSRRLLSNFTLFALVLMILLVTIVFILSLNVSTRLVVNQMAHNAQTVSSEIPTFRANLQNLLVQYGERESLLSNNRTESERMLRQLFRASPFYRRILLVDSEQAVIAFYPPDVDRVTLTDLEQAAVARALVTSLPDITPAQTREDEHTISFVVPVLDEADQPSVALVGRVPQLSLENLIVGLQGTVGQGSGFIVDENSQIIAHPDNGRLLSYWQPPAVMPRLIHMPDNPGIAFQGRQGQTNARELVYYLRGQDHPWTVVITVPYEVVLNLALGIGGPLVLVLLVVAGLFYVNLAWIGRDITRPITELVEASKTIAAGDSWAPSGYGQRDDEVGQLSRAFAQMQRSLKQRLNELSLLLGVSNDVSSSIDINQGMPAVLRGALRGTGAAGARAFVRNPSGMYPLTFGAGPAADAMSTLDRHIMTRMRQSRELVMTTPNQIRAVLDLAEEVEPPVQALIAISLYYRERFQGIFWLGYRQPHNFDAIERNLLHTLAGQASVLVENARLFATAVGGRQQLMAVLDSTSEAVVVTDQTERVLLINRAMERLFNLKASEVYGRPIADVIKSESLVEALTGNDERARNVEIATSDGKTFYSSASTIISNDNQVLGRVAVLHDITHLKEIDEMKSDFVATVSHDLRGPLTFMRGYTTMLPMVGELNEKQREYVDKILNGIDQMAQLVDDLLDLGRIEAGLELKYENIAVEPLLSNIATDYWQHAHLSGIKIEVDVAPEAALVRGDMALVRQAVTNLINNGIKYAPHSGQMMLRAEQLNGQVVISVKDNGPGINKQDQMRLFEKFYRVQRKGTEKIKGSGLGLAIVRSIAERHGGQAWCRSRQGQGSTFYISLPLHEESADETAKVQIQRQ